MQLHVLFVADAAECIGRSDASVAFASRLEKPYVNFPVHALQCTPHN
jgi:hypothetical protein